MGRTDAHEAPLMSGGGGSDHDGIVSVIDFGRPAMRPPMTDFTRLAVQDVLRDLDPEAAFLDRYGTDPRDAKCVAPQPSPRAISTTAWAYRVGDEPFEAQGHRMISDALSLS